MALGEKNGVLPAMALRGGDEPQRAVMVVAVIPGDELSHPGACGSRGIERLLGEAWVAFEGVEQGLGSCGLSLLTAGRLKEGTTPRRCKVASIVAPFMGAPLSECRTSAVAPTPSRRWALWKTVAACAADSSA
jgi:hypothetical protein